MLKNETLKFELLQGLQGIICCKDKLFLFKIVQDKIFILQNMRYKDFEMIVSPARMGRYLQACQGDTKKAMTLYRYNLRLTQVLFTIINCFEIALRNAIDRHYSQHHGANWIQSSVANNGIFDNNSCRNTANIIRNVIQRVGVSSNHYKLLSELDFGFWRYLFASPQYRAGGSNLIHVFINKPISTASNQYNQNYIFSVLSKINLLRNRLAHHEPVCFIARQAIKNTRDVRDRYHDIITLLDWMGINHQSMLYGLDYLEKTCDNIDNL